LEGRYRREVGASGFEQISENVSPLHHEFHERFATLACRFANG
jgi:hypothetical protein